MQTVTSSYSAMMHRKMFPNHEVGPWRISQARENSFGSWEPQISPPGAPNLRLRPNDFSLRPGLRGDAAIVSGDACTE